ncbi:hypothetical protein VPH35_109169 [Triticum aestivum]
MPPLARASQRIRYSKKRKAPPPPPPERDWAELHPDLISCILHRLDQAELLVGGVAGVCRSWRHAARDEPELWRRIDLRGGLWYVPPFRPKFSMETMVRKALRLGAGQTEAFLSEGVSNRTLLLLAERVASMVARMHKLRSLHLVCLKLDNEELATILDNCHDLEYLNMQECSLVYMDNMDDNLRVKLAQINMDNHEHPSDQRVDYEYKIRLIHYELNYRELRDGSLSYYPDYSDSYEEYCYYIGSGDGIDDADLEQYEKILDVKSMRRYLS